MTTENDIFRFFWNLKYVIGTVSREREPTLIVVELESKDRVYKLLKQWRLTKLITMLF